MMNYLTEEQANAVYDVLVEVCGANGDRWYRESFVRYMTEAARGKEWRFQGHLGFGGKCYLNGNRDGLPYVSCYPEDRTPQRDATIEAANARIVEMFRVSFGIVAKKGGER